MSINPEAYIHEKALIEEGVTIGRKTRIWAFVHILPDVMIGDDCNICDHALIENTVILGNRVTVKSGVYIWSGVIIEDDVFIGPCVAFTNDIIPRSKQHLGKYPETILKQGCSIGANSTILPGIEIGKHAMIGAGSVVTRSIPDHGLYYGNPAEFHGWICSCGEKLQFMNYHAKCNCGLTYKLENGKQVILD